MSWSTAALQSPTRNQRTACGSSAVPSASPIIRNLPPFVAAAIVCVVGGCHKPPKSRDVAKRKVAVSVPLTFEVPPDGRASSPMIRVEANGRPTTMIVDTGATYHALQEWFAKQLGPITPVDSSARGHTGQSFSVGEIDNVSLSAAGQVLVRATTLPVVPSAASLKASGIGGFFSPQSIAAPGFTTLLDLQHGRLGVLRGSLTPEDRRGPGDALSPSGIRACRSGDGRPRYIVDVVVAGSATMLELDTGSPETHIFADSKLGVALKPREGRVERRGTVGAEFDARVVPDVSVRIGDVQRTVDLLLVPGSAPTDCPFDGMLGMDILKGCMLALDENGADGRCLTPTKH